MYQGHKEPVRGIRWAFVCDRNVCLACLGAAVISLYLITCPPSDHPITCLPSDHPNSKKDVICSNRILPSNFRCQKQYSRTHCSKIKSCLCSFNIRIYVCENHTRPAVLNINNVANTISSYLENMNMCFDFNLEWRSLCEAIGKKAINTSNWTLFRAIYLNNILHTYHNSNVEQYTRARLIQQVGRCASRIIIIFTLILLNYRAHSHGIQK